MISFGTLFLSSWHVYIRLCMFWFHHFPITPTTGASFNILYLYKWKSYSLYLYLLWRVQCTKAQLYLNILVAGKFRAKRDLKNAWALPTTDDAWSKAIKEDSPHQPSSVADSNLKIVTVFSLCIICCASDKMWPFKISLFPRVK